MVDTTTNVHWWWSTSIHLSEAVLYTMVFDNWLPDGRLVRVTEEGDALVGHDDAWDTLDAPKAVEAFTLLADGIAFFGDATGDLWRVDIDTRTWERVAPDIARARLTLAQNRPYAIAFGAGKLWRIPVAMGTTAESVAWQQVDILGRGTAWPPPTHLATTPYWLKHEGVSGRDIPLGRDQGSASRLGLLYDERTGRLLRFTDLPVNVPARYTFDRRYTASPNGEWLAIDLWALAPDATPTPTPLAEPDDAVGARRQTDAFQEETVSHTVTGRALYVAPSDDLSAGMLLGDVEFVAWLSEPAAVIVRDSETRALSLYRLPITEDARAVALDSTGDVVVRGPISNLPIVPDPRRNPCRFCTAAFAPPHAVIVSDSETGTLAVARLTGEGRTEVAVLDDAGEVLATLGPSIVTTSAEDPNWVLRFDTSGDLLETLELPDGYVPAEFALAVHRAASSAVPATNRVYLSVSRNGTYALVEWDLDR